MSTLNQTKVPIAVESHSKLDLPFDHATTSMFMLLQPVYYRHTMRTESLNLKLTSVVRPNPIVVPTFGRIRQNLRAFFVPYRLVFPNWDSHQADVITSNYSHSSQVVGVPMFDYNCFLDMFTNSSNGLMTITTDATAIANDLWDLKYNSDYYVFTRKGRNFYKILYSLGYSILPSDKNHKVPFNALAFLAYCRVYLDWYANAQYLNSATVLMIERLLKLSGINNQLRGRVIKL